MKGDNLKYFLACSVTIISSFVSCVFARKVWLSRCSRPYRVLVV